MSMFEKINKVIEEQFLGWGFVISWYNKNGELLTTVIEEMLKNEASISQYNIDFNEIFENSKITISYFSIAYIENGKLEHFTYTVDEER